LRREQRQKLGSEALTIESVARAQHAGGGDGCGLRVVERQRADAIASLVVGAARPCHAFASYIRLAAMLEMAWVRDHLDDLQKALRDRGAGIDLAEFTRLDEKRRAALREVEQLKASRNQVSEKIAALKKDKKDAAPLIDEMRGVGDRIKGLDATVSECETALEAWLLAVPNVPHASVPVGRSSEENIEVRRWGRPPAFDFKPLAHWDLGAALGILDFERAAKIAGARFAVYFGAGARLERALINFMLDLHTREHGYTEVLPPFMVNTAAMTGTGNLPKFADDLFR